MIMNIFADVPCTIVFMDKDAAERNAYMYMMIKIYD